MMHSDFEIIREAAILLSKVRLIQDEQSLTHIGPSLLNMVDETIWAHKLITMPQPSTENGMKFRTRSIMGEILRCAVSLRNAGEEAGGECAASLTALYNSMFTFLRYALSCRPDLFPTHSGIQAQWTDSEDGLNCIREKLMLECMPFRDKWVARLGGVYVGMGSTKHEAMKIAELEAETIFGINRPQETCVPVALEHFHQD